VLLANLSSINPNLLSYKVADLFLKDKSIPLPTFKQDNNVVQSWVGDYFDMKTQSLVKINFKNDKLNMGSIELVTTGNNTFKTPNSLSTLTFTNDEQNTQMEVFTQGEGHTTYKKVNKIASSTVNLEEYKGDFYSSELDTKYIVSIKDNSLVIKIPRNDEVKLSPFLEDIFTGNFIIRFQRNKKNKIEGFYLSAGRVRNLYYSKIATQ